MGRSDSPNGWELKWARGTTDFQSLHTCIFMLLYPTAMEHICLAPGTGLEHRPPSCVSPSTLPLNPSDSAFALFPSQWIFNPCKQSKVTSARGDELSAPNRHSLGCSLKPCGQRKKENLNLPLPGQKLSNQLWIIEYSSRRWTSNL